MKSSLLISCIALLCSAAAMLMLAFRSTSTASRSTPSSSVSGALAQPLLSERLDQLSQQNDRLRDRLALLEQRPVAPLRAPVSEDLATLDDLEALRLELQAWHLGQAAGVQASDMSSPAFKDQLASTLNTIRKDEAVRQAQSKQQKRIDSLDESMPKLEEWLGLSRYQSDEMRSALLLQFEREADLLRRWEAGEDVEVLGEVKRSDREAHFAHLGEFLSEEQLETYRSRGGK